VMAKAVSIDGLVQQSYDTSNVGIWHQAQAILDAVKGGISCLVQIRF